MTQADPALIDLIKQLMDVASKRNGYNQGLLAAVFVADALKAGGFPAAKMKLGTTKISLKKNLAGEKLQSIWLNSFGEKDTGVLTHHVLLIETMIVDPVISSLRNDEKLGLYLEGPPAFYGPITVQAIYNN
ncbi:MAG: hypothetical protein P1V97_33515 [Planctomycetota bacterium]|nr:hypothetical protein [Planctomycetota bacterium]